MKVFNFQENEPILLLGEGNFSFCRCLVEYMTKNGVKNFSNLFATCFEEEEASLITEENRYYLLDSGVKLIFDIDATKLSHQMKLGKIAFNKILFNFPHVGGKMKINLNRQLLQDFFLEASLLLADKGKIIVTLCAGQGGTPAEIVKRKWNDTWQIVEMAARSDLVLNEIYPFPCESFGSYVSTGYRGGTKSFNTKNAVVHIFKIGFPVRLSMVVEDVIHQNKILHSIDGVLSVSYCHNNKVNENPFLRSDSPQSCLAKILEDVCQFFDKEYFIFSDSSLFTNICDDPNQATCLVNGVSYFLRSNLLQISPKECSYSKSCLLSGLCFNKLQGDFSVAPAECHVAVFGPRVNEIFSVFIEKLTNLFQPYLLRKNINLFDQKWFQFKDEFRDAVDFNIDQLLTSIFEISWRQVWCPGVEIDVHVPSLTSPSIYFQKFSFDTTFQSSKGPIDVQKIFVLVQQISCDTIDSLIVLSVYQPSENASVMKYCLRFIYKSYYSALCRKKALEYHSLISKVIEQSLHLNIV